MLTGHSHLVYFNDVANYFGSIDYLKSHGLSKAKMYLENSAYEIGPLLLLWFDFQLGFSDPFT